MNLVSTILRSKGYEVYSVQAETSILETLKLMTDKKVGAILAMDKDTVAGIFSERDFARKVASNQGIDLNRPVSDLMTTSVYFVTPDVTVEECMTLMTNKRIRHLPVMENNRLIGLISIRDVVKSLIEERDYMISNMEKYILSSGYAR